LRPVCQASCRDEPPGAGSGAAFFRFDSARAGLQIVNNIVDNLPAACLFLSTTKEMKTAPTKARNRDSLPARVQRAVAEWIFNGELTAGQKLTEQEVAERLGVSRGPVRDAFHALEDFGLLRTEKNRGAFVRKIDLEEALEIHDVYSALEELAARSAAGRLSASQLDQLRSLVESMDAAAESDDLDKYYPLNLRFHQCLVDASGNKRLIGIYRRLLNELHLFRRFGLMQRGEMQRSNREHHQILDKIAAGDSEGAAEAMRNHTSERRRKMLLRADRFDPKSH
jgi:DNA-binding GntR family transcriptional regulator